MQQATIDPTLTAFGPTPVTAHPKQRVTISARFLLAIYVVVPICLLPMLADLWLGGAVKRGLPSSPEGFFIFQLIFGTPHIIASSVILATNGVYVRAFWLRVLLFTLFLLAFFGIGSLFLPYHIFLAIVGAATVLHVIKQQVGIGKGLCRLSSWVYDAWGWTLVVFGSILYYAVYAEHTFSPAMLAWVHATLWGFAGIALLLSLVCHARINTSIGRLYLWGNTVMVLQSGLFYAQGYSFLAILGPRLVHDATAFTFYIAHDINRHGERPRNPLYWLASKLGIGIFWVSPVVATLLTFLIDRYTDPLANLIVTPVLGYNLPYAASFIVVGYLGLLHYYTESFTWQKDSPYRQHIAMAA